MDKKKNSKLSDKSLDSPVTSDSSLSIGDDSNCSSDLFKNRNSMYSSMYVQPTETISEFLLEDEEPTGTDTIDRRKNTDGVCTLLLAVVDNKRKDVVTTVKTLLYNKRWII